MTEHILARSLVAAWLIAAVVQTPPAAPAGIVAGRIVDASGAAVPAAKVVLLQGPSPEGAVRGYPEGTAHVLSDDSGRFVFTGVAAGTYRIEADKPGWLTGSLGRRRPGGAGSTFDLAEGERRNDCVVALWRAAVIGGQVLDDAGDPLIGAEVRAVKQVFIAGRRQADVPLRARTDDRGIYRFSGLLPGEYIVAVLQSLLSEPEGFAGAVLAAHELPASYFQTMTPTGAMPMVFDRAAGVAEPGRPLVGSLSPLSAMPTASAAWPVYLTTYHPASPSLSNATVIRVQAGEVRTDADVTVRLTPTWTVSGVVRDAGGPVAWHAVHLVPADTVDRPLIDVATAVTDSKGAFTLYGVPAGRYAARVLRVPTPSGTTFGLASGGAGEIQQVMAFSDASDAAPASMESLWYANDLVVVGDRPVRDLLLTLREGPRARGRVRFEGSRAQPTIEEWQSATVRLLPANGRIDGVDWKAPISNDGRFTSASIWPGKYLITATPPNGWQFKDATFQGRDVSSRPIDISTDLDNVVITFTDQTHTIKGNVQVEPGSSAEQATVLLFPVEAALWVDFGRSSRTLTSTRVAASGQFTLRLPPAGDYFMIAIPEESIDQWQNPDVLAKLAPLGVRVHVTGDASISQSLQLSRIR